MLVELENLVVDLRVPQMESLIRSNLHVSQSIEFSYLLHL